MFSEHESKNASAPYEASAASVSDTASASKNTPPHTQPTTSDTIRSFFWYGTAALAVSLFVRFFIIAPFLVQGASMLPTFQTWDYLLVDRVTYHIYEPARGDVIVMKFPQDTSRDFIKRIIGLPGETLTLSGTSVTITNAEYPDGFTLDEPYIAPEHAGVSNMSVTLGDGEYFVMGDNRKESADSRYWGALPSEDIVGRVLFRMYPFNQFAFLPGEHPFDNTH